MDFFGALIIYLAALLFGSMLTGKGGRIVRAGRVVVRAGTGYNNIDHRGKHPLFNIKIINYFNFN